MKADKQSYSKYFGGTDRYKGYFFVCFSPLFGYPDYIIYIYILPSF